MKTFLRRVWHALWPNRFDRDPQEGVVRDLGTVGSETGAGLYRPLSPAAAADLRIAVRMNGNPGT